MSFWGKSGVKVRRSGEWKKNWNTKPVDALAVVAERVVPECQWKLSPRCSEAFPEEWAEMVKTFEFGWHVPRV